MSGVGSFFASIDPGPAIKSVGQTIESGVREIGKGAEGLGREVGKVGQAAINDPIGTTLKVAAIATQQYWALPVISAGTVIANGGSIEQAAISAGISAAAMAVSAGISQGLDTAFANELTSSVGDASLTASNTLADGTIQHIFSDGSTILQGVDGAISTTAATVAPSIASQLPAGVLQSINTAMANAGGSAAMTALQGGDFNEILMSGVSSGAGSFAGTQTNAQLKNLGINDKVAQVLGRTTGAATSGAIKGQDASQIFNTALVDNIVRTSLSEAGKSLKNTEVARGLTKNLNDAIQPFKDAVSSTKQSFLDQAKKLTDLQVETDSKAKSLIEQSDTIKAEAQTYAGDTLKSAEINATKAYDTAVSSFNEYKTESDKFNAVVKKYEEAKAANNVELANQYADEANALIPAVNAATEKYNADYDVYDVAKTDFETKNETYLGYVKKLTDLNDEYVAAYKAVDDQLAIVKENADGFNTSVEEMQNTLNTTAKNVEDAYTKASEYDPIAKSTFEKLYGESGDLNRAVNLSEQVNQLDSKQQKYFDFSTNFGLRPEDALTFAPDVSKMDTVSRLAFYDELSKNPDLQNAFSKATEIGSLTDDQRLSYDYGRKYGLDYNTAIDTSKIVGGLSKQEQDAYFNTLKSTGSPELSGLFSLAQSLLGEDTKLSDPYTADLNKLKTPEAKEAYDYYVSVLGPTEALALAKGQDDAILAQGTGTQSAGTSGAYLPPGQTGSVTVTQAPPKFEEIAQKVNELDTKLQSGQITKEEYDKQYNQLVPQPEQPQQPEYTPPDQSDYYQSLIDKLFTEPSSKAKTLATTTPTTGGGTVTQPPATGGGTVTQPPATGGGLGGTQPGTGVGGGTEPGAGGGGGTQPGTGVGDGTGGTGTGGTGGLNLTGGLTGTGGYGYGYGYNALSTEDKYGGIKNLSPGLTQKMDYTLSGIPNIEEQINPMLQVPQFATGGSSSTATSSSTTPYDPFAADISGIKSSLAPGLTKAQLNYILTGLPGNLIGKAEGGSIQNHNPEFFSEGGLGSIKNRYVKGKGDGTSDSIPAMLANGEFVIPADVVSSLGNGSNDAGATILDEFLKTIRKHKRAADVKKLPPDSKGPLGYLLEAKRKVKA